MPQKVQHLLDRHVGVLQQQKDMDSSKSNGSMLWRSKTNCQCWLAGCLPIQSIHNSHQKSTLMQVVATHE
jgi:hypothetical protein